MSLLFDVLHKAFNTSQVDFANTTEIFHPRFLEMLNGTALLRFSLWQMVAARLKTLEHLTSMSLESTPGAQRGMT